jgi:hypothetical protein
MRRALAGRLRLVHLSAKLLAGRRYWVAPLLPVGWVGLQILFVVAGWRLETFEPAEAQTLLIGAPLAVLAGALGVRVIAGDLDQRTLEIAYTVPGGAHRVWLAKLGAGALLLLGAEALLAGATYLFCTAYPPLDTLYGALQGAVFYMVAAMALAVFARSEATGAMLAVGVGLANLFASDLRVSPFWNRLSQIEEHDAANVLAWTVQNRIGFALAIGVVCLLAFGRAERREVLLSG